MTHKQAKAFAEKYRKNLIKDGFPEAISVAFKQNESGGYTFRLVPPKSKPHPSNEAQ